MTSVQRDDPRAAEFYTLHFGREDLHAFEQRGDFRRNEPAPAEQATATATATALSWVGHGEDTYIPYTYLVDGLAYCFLYLTPYDELHRAYGNHPAEWYDELGCGVLFEVAYDPDDPARHRVLDPRFQPLGGQAMFAGTTAVGTLTAAEVMALRR